MCDRGYSGNDCSQRLCPHGDDVLTTCAVDANEDVQVISFSDPSADLAANMAADAQPLFYTLSFVDSFGGRYKTRPIAFSSSENFNSHDAQAALESLPNFAIPTVQVSSDTTALTVEVTFSSSATSGLQNTLEADIVHDAETCAEGGQMPYTINDASLNSVSVSVAHQALATETSSYEENVPCGNRGICDSTTGKCNCFEGHTGEACGIQSVFV